MYWESARGAAAAAGHPVPEVSLPVAFTVFPGEIFQAPRSWAEQVYPNLIYFHEAGKGRPGCEGCHLRSRSAASE